MYSPRVKSLIGQYDKMVVDYIGQALRDDGSVADFVRVMGKPGYFTPWRRLETWFVFAPSPGRAVSSKEELWRLIAPIVQLIDVDVEAYVETYRDIAGHPDPALHWRVHGYFEGGWEASSSFLPVVEPGHVNAIMSGYGAPLQSVLAFEDNNWIHLRLLDVTCEALSRLNVFRGYHERHPRLPTRS